MRLIQTKAELLPWIPGVEGMYKMIEMAGRTCYKSEDKITEDSAKPFVDRMIASKHLAMLEHGTVYLYHEGIDNLLAKYNSNKYSKYVMHYIGESNEAFAQEDIAEYVTTNLRVLVENDWLDDLKYFCDPTEYHELRYTFKMTTSIGVTRELNRHRVHSIAEQSTRYCNYSKDKFENELVFVKPAWLDLNLGVYKHVSNGVDLGDIVGDGYIKNVSNTDPDNQFLEGCLNQEAAYMSLITDAGWHQQQAREMLPLCLASEIVHTAFASDWCHFFELRLFESTGKVHPNMMELVKLMADDAVKNGVWEDIMKSSPFYKDSFDESKTGTATSKL